MATVLRRDWDEGSQEEGFCQSPAGEQGGRTMQGEVISGWILDRI